MSKLLAHLKNAYLRLIGSIAFWPSVICIGFLATAVLVLSLESKELNRWLMENLSHMAVDNPENARLVLGTLAGGTITLTVFSFTMVMVVLNQAGSNLSPRVIPGLITKRSHQVVLGFYLGTTMFLLLMIMGFKERDEISGTPMAGVLLSIVFGVVCLVLFVYFIHSISRSIQVNSVLTDIYQQGLNRYKARAEDENTEASNFLKPDDIRNTTYIGSEVSGYVEHVDIRRLLKIACAHDLTLQIHARVGNFTQIGEWLLEEMGGKRVDDEILKLLLEAFVYSNDEVNVEDTEISMKRISEIGVRALSPGVNDPGTAITSIDLLTDLLITEMWAPQRKVYCDKKGTVRIIIPAKPLQILLNKYWVPIRHYGRDNLNINLKMLYNLNTLRRHAPEIFLPLIIDETTALQESYDAEITLPQDRKKITDAEHDIERLNSLGE